MALLMLIDGQSLVSRAFFALPTDIKTRSGQVTNAVYGFTAMFVQLLRDYGPGRIAVAFDAPGPGFRTGLLPGYRATRYDPPEALRQQLGLVRQVAEAMQLPVLEAPEYQAADVLASLATKAAAADEDVVVVTGDSNAYQLVADPYVKVLYSRRAVSDFVLYDEAGIVGRTGVSPCQYPDFAALRGDTFDNVVGVPGVGEKTAARLLRAYGCIDGLYAHLPELAPGRLYDSLAACEAQVRANARALPLVVDVPVNLGPHDGVVGRWDLDRVKELFLTLEFGALWDRFAKAAAPYA